MMTVMAAAHVMMEWRGGCDGSPEPVAVRYPAEPQKWSARA